MMAKTQRSLLTVTMMACLMTASVGAVSLTATPDAQAQDKATWSIISINTRGVDPDVGVVFRELLQNEISTINGAPFVQPTSAQVCSDVNCARQAGASAGANVAVYGALSSLGSKIFATLTVVDVETGNVLSNQKMAVDRVDDLDKVALRMARAIMGGTNTDETAELGTITKEDKKVDERREGARGLSLRVGGVIPVNDSYGATGSGVLMDLGYWFEARDFAIEGRIGLRFDTGDENGSFFEFPIDAGFYYFLGRGDFAPFVGGGAGIRYISESRLTRIESGTVVPELTETTVNASGWGFSPFARAGVMLFRTYSLRMAISVDYNITFVDVGDAPTPQSLTAGVALMF